MVEPIYEQAFPLEGKKTKKIIQSMLERRIGYLHLFTADDTLVGMAITAHAKSISALIIDYLAVRQDVRGRGVGRAMLEQLKQWAFAEWAIQGLIIEVESEDTVENRHRLRFWEQSGFHLTRFHQSAYRGNG